MARLRGRTSVDCRVLTLFAEIDEQLALTAPAKPTGRCPDRRRIAAPGGLSTTAAPPRGHGPPYCCRTDHRCLHHRVDAGRPATPVDTSFPTIMTGLNCGTRRSSWWADHRGWARRPVGVTDDEARGAVADLADLGLRVGPCGAAALAGARALLVDRRSGCAGYRPGIGRGAGQYRGPGCQSRSRSCRRVPPAPPAREQLSIPVDEDLLGSCLGGRLGGVRVGSFDEPAGLEARAGPDQSDEVG